MQSTEFDVVLCAVDFSALSAGALRQAAVLASCGNARLVAAHVAWFEPPAYFTVSRVEKLKNEFRASMAAAEASLQSFVKATLGEGAAPVETRVMEGAPAGAILKLAAELRAGAIVMGTHGRSGYSHWILGSVAERVIRESSVPVLTTRNQTPSSHRSILCPIDGSPASREALRSAAALASCGGASLTALHVLEDGAAPAPPAASEWLDSAGQSLCKVREIRRHGDPAAEIVRMATEESFDLIVLGAPRRSFFEGFVIGTTTLRAVRHAPCPVLTVPEPLGSGDPNPAS